MEFCEVPENLSLDADYRGFMVRNIRENPRCNPRKSAFRIFFQSPLCILDLGLLDYLEAYKIQKQTWEEVRLGSRNAWLILVEHPHVFTIGRSGCRDNILINEQSLLKEGIKVYFVDRGGDVTYHGPGQLLIYPIVDLKKMKMGVCSFLRRLEGVVSDFLQSYGVSGERKKGQTGIWIKDEKIASIGIGISNWITYHGLAINIDPNLHYFSYIHPCGIPNLKMTSLVKLLGKKISMEEVKEFFINYGWR